MVFTELIASGSLHEATVFIIRSIEFSQKNALGQPFCLEKVVFQSEE